MILKILGTALLLLISAYLLRSLSFRGAPVFAAIAAILLLAESGEGVGYIFGRVKELSELSNISEPTAAALKILGIGYLFGICADVCRELSEPGIAKAVEMVGRVEIFTVVIPYFEKIIRAGAELLG